MSCGSESEVDRLRAQIRDLEEQNRSLKLELEIRAASQAREEERVRLILESASEYAIFTLDANAFVTSWNRGAERLMGYSEQEIVGKDGRVLFTLEDRHRETPEWEIEQALLEGHATNERWHLRKDGSRFWGSGTVMRLQVDHRGEPGVLKILRDDTQRRHAEEQRRLLIGELNHRVKNTLASVQSIVSQTLRTATDMQSVNELLRSRIFALARAHDLLTRETWSGATISDVAHAALDPWLDGGQIEIRGPHARLSTSQALALSMAFHELAVNAAKYGALSVPEGRVNLEWSSTCELLVTWIETEGPPVSPPQRQGFGSRILNRALAIELGGDVSLSFEPDGLRCSIRVPDPGI